MPDRERHQHRSNPDVQGQNDVFRRGACDEICGGLPGRREARGERVSIRAVLSPLTKRYGISFAVTPENGHTAMNAR